MPLPSSRWDVFIAHAPPDQAQADALYDLLSPHLRVFLDTRCLMPGDDWPRVVPAALQASSITAVLVSQRVDVAYYADEQIAIAIDLARKFPGEHRVVPLLLQDMDEQGAFLPYGLRSKQGLFSRTAEEQAQAAARLVELAGGQAPRPGARWADVWAPSAPAPAEASVRPAAFAAVEYPPLRFLPDHGDEVWVREPARLADLLEQNPENGRVFLYRRYYERGGWDKANPGLCAALTVLIEQRHPDDPAAGLTAALYLLDPRRPYRHGTETAQGNTSVAAHLAAHADDYRDLLREKTHPLWLYLASRSDPAVREGARAFAAAFAEIRAQPGENAAAAVAVNRLIVWLRGLDGETGLPFGGGHLAAPAEILDLPPGRREAAAGALGDRTSLLSVWVEERAPELSRLVATWRRVHPGDLATLPHALGEGVPAGPGQVRGPEDVLEGPPEVAQALWTGTDALRERVDTYLSTFHFVPLARPALDRLRALPGDPLSPAVAAYVARHAAALRDGAPGSAEGQAGSAALSAVVAVVFHALDAVAGRRSAPLPADEAWIADELARESVEPLLARPLSGAERLERVAAFLGEAARHAEAAGGHPVEGALWARFLAAADDAVTRARRAGAVDPGVPEPELRAAEARVAAVLPGLRGLNLVPGLLERDAREQAARERLSAAVEVGMDVERTRAEGALDRAEQAARATLRKRARRVPPLSYALRAARRARAATLILLAGLAVFSIAATSALRRLAAVSADYRALFPDEPRGVLELYSSMLGVQEGDAETYLMNLSMTALVAVIVLVAGGVVAAAGGRWHPLGIVAGLLFCLPASVTAAVYVPQLHPITPTYLLLALAAVAAAACVATWRGWIRWRDEARRWLEGVDAHPALVGEFRERRLAARRNLAWREAEWTAGMRRAIALADAPETVELSPAPRGEDPLAGLAEVAGGWTRPLPDRLPDVPSSGHGAPPSRRGSARVNAAAAVGALAACGYGAVAVQGWTGRDHVVIDCPDRARVEQLTTRYLDRGARMKFKAPDGAERRWSMVMGPFPRARARSMLRELETGEFLGDGAYGGCYPHTEMQP